MSLKAKIKRLDLSLPVPKYETSGSFGFDLIVREQTEVLPGQTAFIPGNVIIECPEDYSLLILPRSSMYRKTGLVFPHSIGLIDRDYCGPEDEIKIMVLNPSDKPIIIDRGQRIAQGVFVHTPQIVFEEVDEIGTVSRGGFGSTGD